MAEKKSKDKPPVKLPKTLGAMCDLLWKTREERYSLQAKAKKIQEAETYVKEEILKALGKARASSAGGKLARVETVPRIATRVDDWDALRKFVVESDAWELLQKRVGESALRERWEKGESVPGVSPDPFTDLSIHRVTR